MKCFALFHQVFAFLDVWIPEGWGRHAPEWHKMPPGHQYGPHLLLGREKLQGSFFSDVSHMEEVILQN